jgi:hypothetical protein
MLSSLRRRPPAAAGSGGPDVGSASVDELFDLIDSRT